MPDQEQSGSTFLKIRSADILEKEASSSPDPLIRAYSVYLLAQEKDPLLKKLFLSAIRDRDKRVRAQAAAALSALGEDALEDLILLLNDEEWSVRYRAAEALGKIPSSRGADHLIRALTDGKDHVRYMAVKSLGALEERDAVPGIIQKLSDENECVRRMAVTTLGNIGGEDALPALVHALKVESSESVRDAIRIVLQKKTG